MADNTPLFGRILRVNLSDENLRVEECPPGFFRKYIGGAIGAYYLLKASGKGIDPLGPQNIITFVPGLLSHLASGVYSRAMISSKSPLSNAIIDSQAGGFWARECKTAGFDAIVIEGRASQPVYLLVKDGKAELHSARTMWGLDTGPSEEAIRSETGLRRLPSFTIGPGGENMVRYACVANNLRHFAGRGGLGAVMGSKNLKSVAVIGNPETTPSPVDKEKVSHLLKDINQAEGDDEFMKEVLRPFGTHWAVWFNQSHGKLPTRNFREGTFNDADLIDHRTLAQHEMNKPSGGCFGCRVRCKRVVGTEKGPLPIDKRYGGAEYESSGNLGSLLGISDLVVLEKANELCSKYTLDTISTGATIAWAIDCFEKGMITTGDTGGMELRWGDGEGLLSLIDQIAHRQGFGDLLAEGSRRASAHFGPDAEQLAAHCKGVEWPAVDPRMDMPQALAYAVSPIGADHMTTGGPDCGPEFWELETPLREEGLSANLVRAYYYQRMLGSAIDGLGMCRFLIGTPGFKQAVDLFEPALGWKVGTWELMRAGERRMTLFKAFNAREGLTIKDDMLPPRAFMPLENGPEAGAHIVPQELHEAVKLYYALCGWDPASGWPTEGKLLEMGLEWVRQPEENQI